MTFVLLSNFLNHHQLPFCLNMYNMLGDDFRFIATTPMFEEQQRLGYPDLNNEYPFVIRTYDGIEENNQAKEWINKADVVVMGSAPFELLAQRMKNKKLTFLYSERIYKKRYQRWKWPIRMWRFWKKYGRHKNCYLLCASAYTAADYAKTYTFIDKTFKWGYFPEVKKYDSIASLIDQKESASIMWAGRFLDWKHPEYVVEIARRLREDGYAFHINMLGNGAQWETIRDMVEEYGLREYVELLGAMPPEQVRSYMEKSQIYLFTSDRQEGWGAVLNESMNSGCAVVACDAIGAVPFLMNNEHNGMIYRSGNVEDLYQKLKYLIDNPDECVRLGTNAYTTMTDVWNANIAAERLLNLSEKLLQGEKERFLYSEGPCSKALILKG